MAPRARAPVPAGVEVDGPGLLRIKWDDDATLVSEYPAWDLRVSCRCAHCVSETSGVRLLDPATVPPDVTITGAQLTGNYGVTLAFSDRHGTGIYSWELLASMVDPDMAARLAELAAELG